MTIHVSFSDASKLRWLSSSGAWWKHVTAKPELVDDVARVTVEQTKGLSNPLTGMPEAWNYFAGKAKIPESWALWRPDLVRRTHADLVRGTGSGALEDAVKALNDIGTRHGVTGVWPSMHGNPSSSMVSLSNFGHRSGWAVGVDDPKLIEHIGQSNLDDLVRRGRDLLYLVQDELGTLPLPPRIG